MFLLSAFLTYVSIVPHPKEVTEIEGQYWDLIDGMQIGYSSGSKEFTKELAQFFSDSIYTPTGIRLSVVESSDVKIGIQLDSSDDDEYHLLMDESLVKITGKNRELVFDGFQTLLQLFPPQIYSNKTVKQSIEWKAPCVTVHDKPRLQWRGLMIDVCRHFFDVDTVKSIIDGMSHFKLNNLHLHLTEDQGWRIELKKFPNLTKYGSIRDASPKHRAPGELDGIPYGPYYYTEEQIRDIIEYARMRSITVMPEIEMPGHALAYLSAYPQYSCTGGPFKPRCFWGVENDIICAGNDEGIAFLEQIIDEVLNIFDNVFIHLGGDECPRTRWETCPKCQKRIKDEGLSSTSQLQCWFTRYFSQYLESKGRRLVGWDEVLDGYLDFPKSTVIMQWRSAAAGMAARRGYNVVVSPNFDLYLDFQQYQAPEHFEYGGGFITTYHIFQFNPAKELYGSLEQYLLGLQGNLWSEYIWERADLQWKAFPRAVAVAVSGWEEQESKDWVRFMHDFAVKEKEALQQMGINDAGLQYGEQGGWKKGQLSSEYTTIEMSLTNSTNAKGNIEVAFVHTGGKHDVHVKNVKLLFNNVLVASDSHEGIINEVPQNSLYSLSTDQVPSPTAIKVQADMMCDGGDDCEGIIYLYQK